MHVLAIFDSYVYRTVVLSNAQIIKEAFNMTEFSGRADLQTLVEAPEKKGKKNLN